MQANALWFPEVLAPKIRAMTSLAAQPSGQSYTYGNLRNKVTLKAALGVTIWHSRLDGTFQIRVLVQVLSLLLDPDSCKYTLWEAAGSGSSS